MTEKLKTLVGIAAWQNLLPHLFIFHMRFNETNYWTYMCGICQSNLPYATHATHVEIFNLKNTLRKVN
jgi:hypothetical protein